MISIWNYGQKISFNNNHPSHWEFNQMSGYISFILSIIESESNILNNLIKILLIKSN